MSDSIWGDITGGAAEYLNPLTYLRSESAQATKDVLAQAQQAVDQVRQSQAWRKGMQQDIPSLAAMGLGLGAGFRGLQELIRGSYQAPSYKYSTGPAQLNIPVAVRPDEDEEKQAAETSFIDSSPWALPAMFAAGVIPAVGAYKLTDRYLDNLRRQDAEEEYEKEKQKFHQTVLEQYARGRGWRTPKVSSPMAKAAEAFPATDTRKTDRLDALLKEAFDLLQEAPAEKQAISWNSVGGTALTALGLVGIPSFLAGLSAGNERTNRAILARALKKRQQQQWAQQPFELQARPLPIVVEDEGEDGGKEN